MATKEDIIIVDADEDLDSRPARIKKPGKKQNQEDEQFDFLDTSPPWLKGEDEADDADDEDRADSADEASEEDDETTTARAHEDDDDEDDLRSGSNEQWRRRLARERRLRDEAEQDASHYQQEFQRVDKRLDEISRKLESQKSSGELDRKIDGLIGTVGKIKEDLKAATEAGDTDKIIDLQEKLSDTKAELKLAEYQKAQVKEAASAAAADTTKTAPAPNRHLTRWMRQHGRRYNSDEVFKRSAETISAQLIREGFPANDPDHFTELNKRLASMFPKEFPKGNQARRRPPIGSGEESGAPERTEGRGDKLDIRVRGNRAQLTREHESIMRKFGMDPEDAEDRKAFVRENITRKGK